MKIKTIIALLLFSVTVTRADEADTILAARAKAQPASANVVNYATAQEAASASDNSLLSMALRRAERRERRERKAALLKFLSRP